MSDRSYLTGIFLRELNVYMQKLQQKGEKDILPAYLLLAPPEHLEESATNLIKNRKDFDNFNWK
jgi:hypothetical protein